MEKTVLIKNIKSKKGFTLLELLLVLGIIAALVVAAFIVYPKVRDSRYVDIEAKHIGQIYASVKSAYAGQPDYRGLSTTAVSIPAQFFPDDMLTKNITWGMSSWGGYVVVDANNISPSGASNSSFTITYSDVPANVCTRLITSVGSTFFNIYVSNVKGIVDKNSGTLVKNNGGDIDVVLTASVCSAGNLNNQISFLSL